MLTELKNSQLNNLKIGYIYCERSRYSMMVFTVFTPKASRSVIIHKEQGGIDISMRF